MNRQVELYEREQFSKEVEDLLGRMSLEEKVGQMTQVNINLILEGGYASTDGTINKKQLEEAVLKYKVGSLLNAVPGAYDVDKWHQLLTQIQDAALQTPNQIPVIYGIDAIHGATYTKNSTLVPHNIGMAATRNPALAYQVAAMTAKEVRASGIRWNFDPCIDVGRMPLWGRFEETFGEDPVLTTKFAEAIINGYQDKGLKSEGSVASCMKHYLGYSMPRTGKDRTPSYIPEIELREIYLPPFEAAIKAGSPSIMINSGEVNGVPVHASKYLLKDVLREELGFKGVVVSDWEDIIRLHTRHRVAATPKEAVKVGVMAGVDMSMVPHDYSFYDYLIELVNDGEVPVQRIDEAAGRILQLKFDVGLFDNPYPEKSAKENFGKAEYDSLALEAALESLVLLKNSNNILPLKKDQKVLLTGPAANNIPALSGSWSYTWQGTEASAYPEDFLSIKAALSNHIGNKTIISNASTNWDDESNYNSGWLKSQAKNADVIILCLGENAYAESPGGIDDLMLPQKQLDLAKAAAATGKPVILILAEGRPRIFTDVEQEMDAVLLAMRPASQGANAIVDVLYGNYNPSGRLPFTYHKSTGDLVPYDAKGTDLVSEITPNMPEGGGYKPLYKFGHGLSYSDFSLKNLRADKTSFSGDETVKIRVDVTNNGPYDGDYAIDLYSRDLFASVTPSDRRLRDFKKIYLKNGESKTVEFEIDRHDLSFINTELQRVTEPGEFEILVGEMEVKINFSE